VPHYLSRTDAIPISAECCIVSDCQLQNLLKALPPELKPK
jgi:hypothetical protein